MTRVTCVEANRIAGRRDLAVIARGGESRLMVRFPDTDDLVGAPDDGRTLVGSTTLAVTAAGAPLPCALATTRCADAGDLPGLVACLDELYRRDESTCQTADADRDPTFSHFTALPPVNDYRTILAAPGGGDAEIRFALDSSGAALIPIDWRGALIEKTSSAITRQLRGLRTVEAFLGLTTGVAALGPGIVTSHDLRGVALPPLYRPDSPAYQETLFGTIDVPRNVVRIAAGACADGTPCAAGARCAHGTCRALFADTPAVADGGPRVIPRPALHDDQRQACVVPDEMSLLTRPDATL
jgi:hypothetical protein